MSLTTDKPVTIYFITLVPFPYGMAQTNRLISIARGLISAGGLVKVICLKPTESTNPKNKLSQGIFEDIEYIYPSGTTIRSRNPIVRSYRYFSGFIKSALFLFKENKKKKVDFIFAGVIPLFSYFLFYAVSKILHSCYMQERSEYPCIKARKSVFDPVTLSIYLNLVCKLFDGFLVITGNLKKYFTPYLRKNCPVFYLPILVEFERFSTVSAGGREKYIAYCGSMQGNKDGIPDLIDAFSILNQSNSDIKLFLIGSTEFPEFPLLKSRISDLSLNNSIVFTGEIDRNELPAVLKNAMILVLARPDSIQAQGGFPTKLGEYLATGKPVLVTNVGEISDYLHDGVNAYVTQPGDPGEFASKMKYILEHYDEALITANNGLKLAETVFNNRYQGKLLIKWLKNFLNKNG